MVQSVSLTIVMQVVNLNDLVVINMDFSERVLETNYYLTYSAEELLKRLQMASLCNDEIKNLGRTIVFRTLFHLKANQTNIIFRHQGGLLISELPQIVIDLDSTTEFLLVEL